MPDPTAFEDAAQQRTVSLPRQFLQFIVENKKWWLLPIALVLGVIGLLALFATAGAASGAAPFIYTIF